MWFWWHRYLKALPYLSSGIKEKSQLSKPVLSSFTVWAGRGNDLPKLNRVITLLVRQLNNQLFCFLVGIPRNYHHYMLHVLLNWCTVVYLEYFCNAPFLLVVLNHRTTMKNQLSLIYTYIKLALKSYLIIIIHIGLGQFGTKNSSS